MSNIIACAWHCLPATSNGRGDAALRNVSFFVSGAQPVNHDAKRKSNKHNKRDEHACDQHFERKKLCEVGSKCQSIKIVMTRAVMAPVTIAKKGTGTQLGS